MRKRGKNKKKRRRIPPVAQARSDYEGFTCGPLTVERFGRSIVMSSHWEKKKHDEFLARVRQNRPQVEQEINDMVREALQILNQNNVFDLLTRVFLSNGLADPESYTESTYKGVASYIEYALSLAMVQVHDPSTQPHPTDEVTEQFFNLIAEIHNSVRHYFSSEAAENLHDRGQQELRFSSIIRCLLGRGDSYREHHVDLVGTVFGQHDNVLLSHIGLTSGDVLTGYAEIETQLQANVSDTDRACGLVSQLHRLFKAFVGKQDGDPEAIINSCKDLPEVKKLQAELEKIQANLGPELCRLTINDRLPKTLLDLLSAEFGDNHQFIAFDQRLGWPLNDSIVYRRPLLRCGDEYYCFGPHIIFYNLIDILQDVIREHDSAYYNNVYTRKRARTLEEVSIGYFRQILRGCTSYTNLRYRYVEEGQCREGELDALVIYDTNVFLIECKAGELHDSATRGALPRMTRDLRELVDAAYEQGLRTKSYIESTTEPVFLNDQGQEIRPIQKGDLSLNYILVNVTLQNLAQYATQLDSLKHLGLLKNGPLLWSVFINDLRIISEIVESPATFLLYLERRLEMYSHVEIMTWDELDLFMFFLKDGLYFAEGTKDTSAPLSLIGYTETLDRYYDFIAGRVSSGHKPCLEIPSTYKDLVRRVEEFNLPGSSLVAKTLLSFDKKHMKELIDLFNVLKSKTAEDDKRHDMTLTYYGQQNLFIFLFSCPPLDSDPWHGIDRHCRMKMYQFKLENGIALAVNVADDQPKIVGFRIFREKWRHDEALEAELAWFKQRKLNKLSEKEKRELGPNDPCPCHSGRKFKKCCGKQS